MSLVYGNSMGRNIVDFRRACEVHIEAEQQKANPDNSLISVLCDAVRLSREQPQQPIGRRRCGISEHRRQIRSLQRWTQYLESLHVGHYSERHALQLRNAELSRKIRAIKRWYTTPWYVRLFMSKPND